MRVDDCKHIRQKIGTTTSTTYDMINVNNAIGNNCGNQCVKRINEKIPVIYIKQSNCVMDREQHASDKIDRASKM